MDAMLGKIFSDWQSGHLGNRKIATRSRISCTRVGHSKASNVVRPVLVEVINYCQRTVLVALADSDSSEKAIGAISIRILECHIVRHTSEKGSGTIDRHLRRSADAWDENLPRYRWGGAP